LTILQKLVDQRCGLIACSLIPTFT